MLRTLTEICQEIRNWFEKKKYYGGFSISDNMIHADKGDLVLQEDQYFRIIGSVFNDGIWQYKSEGIQGLKTESFKGSVWALAIPENVLTLGTEIDDWRKKYESSDSQAMSPFNSESFGGYSYSKSSGGASMGGGSSWKSVFADALNRWRKI